MVGAEVPSIAMLPRWAKIFLMTMLVSSRRTQTNMRSSVVIIDDNDTRSCKVTTSWLRARGIVCEDIVAIEGRSEQEVGKNKRTGSVLDWQSTKMGLDQRRPDIDNRWEWKDFPCRPSWVASNPAGCFTCSGREMLQRDPSLVDCTLEKVGRRTGT